ncbi:MAG: hypothetical protein ACRDPI_05930 [Nocardioidaceae bacterium]
MSGQDTQLSPELAATAIADHRREDQARASRRLARRAARAKRRAATR